MHFSVGPAEGFEWVFLRDSDDLSLLDLLDGTRRSEGWVPKPVYRGQADDHLAARSADFPWFDFGLAMRRSAVTALSDLLLPNGEVLPLQTDDGVELFVFNAKVLAALDEEKSEIRRFPKSARIMQVARPVLIESLVRDVDIFRLPMRSPNTYVSDRFVKRVTEAALTGLRFRPVHMNGGPITSSSILGTTH